MEYTSIAQAHNNGNLMQQFIQMRRSSTEPAEIRFRQDYQYDALNRLSSAVEAVEQTPEAQAAAGWQRGWGYDSRGNLVLNSSSDPAPAGTPTALAQYDELTNRLKYFRPTAQAADLLNYDASGNLTDRPANVGTARTTYAYDAENRVVSVDGGAAQVNVYDGFGRRVMGTAGGLPISYLYGKNGELVLEYGSSVTVGGVQFLAVDHLGSTRVTTKPDGTVVARTDYEPYGLEVATPSRIASGYAGDPGQRMRFTGKERDAETGLDYFGARYMSSAQGRFTSPDAPFADQQPIDPQSWNMYAYGRNNPHLYTDPDGRRVRICITGGTCFGVDDGAYPELGPGNAGVVLPTFRFGRDEIDIQSITCGGQFCGTATYTNV